MNGNGNGGREASRTRTTTPLAGSLLSPARIGDVNRSRVLEALCNNGALSRADLARMAGVTRATIGNIVQDLLDANLLEELEPRETGTVGKPARPLWFAPRAGLSGAVALGAGTCEIALVSARGELLAETVRSFDADAKDADAVTAALFDGLAEVLPDGEEVLGVGVAVPGVCDPTAGVVLGSGQLPGLDDFALADALSKRFGVLAQVDNDARAQALGEKWFGEGRGVATFASVQTGHGLGLGLVIDGVIYRGSRGLTGELGHTCVVSEGGEACRCGLHGCWETIATLRWLRREAKARGIKGASSIDAASLVALAESSTDADELLDLYAENLAIGLANLIQMFSPQRVILHGDVVAAGAALLDRIADRTHARVLGFLAEVDIVLSPLDQRAGLLGGAALVLSETFRIAR